MNLRVKNKLVIGLSGCMLSGKSLALSYFAACGADTLSADDLAHEALQSAAGKKAVLSAFGTVEKEALSRLVFKNASARKRLEHILHPLVLKEAARRIVASKKKRIIFEVPLLFELGLQNSVDLTLLLVGGAEKGLSARLKERGISLAEYKKRLKTQKSEEEKAFCADLVIVNNQTKWDLKNKVQRTYAALSKIYD